MTVAKQSRPPGSGDATALAALHAACFSYPWDEAAFTALLALPTTGGLVLPSPSGGLGAALLWQMTGAEAEILTLAVHPDLRRRGVASGLLDAMIVLLGTQGAGRIDLEVASDNQAAIALYVRHHWKEIGRRAGYYIGVTGETDAIVMTRPLPAKAGEKA